MHRSGHRSGLAPGHTMGKGLGKTLKVVLHRSAVVETATGEAEISSKAGGCDPGPNNWRNRRRARRGMRVHLTDAPVSTKVANKCRYRCKSCRDEFSNYRDVRAHLKARKACMEAAKKLTWIDFVTRKVAHPCRLCGDLVPCDRKIIGGHVNMTHRILLKSYIDLGARKGRSNLRNTDKNAIGILPCRKRKKLVRELEEYLEEKDRSDEVANRCTFRCPECGEDFKSSVCFRRHYKKAGSTCRGATRIVGKDILEMVTKAVSYQCNICQCLLLCDRQIIAVHSKSNHGLHIESYVEFAKNEHTDVQAAREQQEVMFQEKKKELQFLLDKVPTVPSRLFVTSTVLPQYIPRQNTTHSTMSICKFSCPKCSFDTCYYTSLKRHLQNCSGSGKFNNKNILEARAHICYICSKRILCDTYWIREHVLRGHKEDFDKYKERSQAMEEAGTTVDKTDTLPREEGERNRRRALVPVVVSKASFRSKSKTTAPPSLVPREKTTWQVDNFCVFRCSVCLSFETDRLHPMMYHRRKCSGREAPSRTFNADDLFEAR